MMMMMNPVRTEQTSLARKKKKNKKRTVVQFQLTDWPKRERERDESASFSSPHPAAMRMRPLMLLTSLPVYGDDYFLGDFFFF